MNCLPSSSLRAIIQGTESVARDQRDHLASCPSCLEQLVKERRAIESSGAATSTDVPHRPRDAVTIPGYRDLRHVSTGGQASVWEATQESTGRRVAVKLLLGARDPSPRQLARFEREVELVSRLNHPNVVTVLDSGVRDGLPWLAMELVEGKELQEHVRDCRPELRDLIELYVQVLQGVEHAHQRGVVHRDLKPANVRVDRDGRPRVLDFGVASELSRPDRPLTDVGAFVGTVGYAAPEQLRGHDGTVDTRADVHALGAILHELLTGRRLRPPGKELGELLTGAGLTTAAAPSQLGADVDRDLDTIVLKALAVDPERRYGSVATLRADLQAWLDGEPIAARRASTLYVVGKLLSRHRLVSASLALTAVTLIAALLLQAANQASLVEAREQAEAEAQAARVAEQDALAERDLAREVTEILSGLFESASPFVGERNPRAAALLSGAATRVRTSEGLAPAARAKLLASLARANFDLGRTDPACELQAESVALLRQQGSDERELALGLRRLAECPAMHAGGDHASATRAESLLRESSRLLESVDGPKGTETLRTTTELARVLAHRPSTREEAERILELNLGEARAASDRELELEVRLVQAMLSLHSDDHDETECLLEECLDLALSIHPAGHADVAEVHEALLRAAARRADLAGVTRWIDSHLEDVRRTWGETSPRYVMHLMSKAGEFLRHGGAPDRAVALLEDALELDDSNVVDDVELTLLQRLSNALQAQRRQDEAIAVARQALRLSRDHGDAVQVGWSSLALGSSLHDNMQYEQAIGAFEEGLRAVEGVDHVPDQLLAELEWHSGVTLGAHGLAEESLPYFVSASERMLSPHGDFDIWDRHAITISLAGARIRLGQWDESLESARLAAELANQLPESEGTVNRVLSLNALALAAGITGATSEADAALAQVLEQMPESVQVRLPWRSQLDMARAAILSGAGDEDAAVELLQVLLRDLRADPQDLSVLERDVERLLGFID